MNTDFHELFSEHSENKTNDEKKEEVEILGLKKIKSLDNFKLSPLKLKKGKSVVLYKIKSPLK
jgi:hypothetical protein